MSPSESDRPPGGLVAPPPSVKLPDDDEIRARRAACVAAVPDDLDGLVLFVDAHVSYLSGFTFVATERPMALLLSREGATVLLVPRLEAEHARSQAAVDEIVAYEEYPGPVHPMRAVADACGRLGFDRPGRRLGVDNDGYPPLWGYRGPALSEVAAADLEVVGANIDDVMMVKSEREIGLLRLSGHWAGRAHRHLQDLTRVGLTETEVAQRASAAATTELVDAHPDYQAGSTVTGATAGYRGQIGRQGALPHTMGANVAFRPGDTLVTGATAPMWGYVGELERTMFLGAPGPRQRELFGHMLALQDLCIDAIRPGVTAGDVDRAMRAYFEAEGLWDHWRHHVGHGIGRRFHENPFLDRGDETPLVPGMTLTVEPGLYDAAWGGFRHSDTVLVTEAGSELLTVYPRNLEDLILPVE